MGGRIQVRFLRSVSLRAPDRLTNGELFGELILETL